MKKKMVKNYIYEGLGFPVELEEVEMIEMEGEWHPKIDVRKIADKVIKKLSNQPTRLTGNQVRFIRAYFSMSLREFGDEVVHESHSAVKKWESCGDKITNMDINIEAVLRLYIHQKLISKSKKDTFYDKLLKFRTKSSKNKKFILTVNCKENNSRVTFKKKEKAKNHKQSSLFASV